MALKIRTVMTYPLTGAVDFAITFEYLARKFVTVTLIGKDRKELVLNQDYRFTTKTQITTTRAWTAADGYDSIEIRRFTSATDRLVDFADGSILRAYDLNISQIQTLHVAEEARDLTAATIGVNNDGHLDARGRRIVNLANAVDDHDAVPLGQLKTMDKNSWQARNEALQFRNEAETFRNKAEGFKNESSTHATNAKQWRDEANEFRNEAEQFKNTSGQYADAAGSSAGNAKDSEDEARQIAASIKAAGRIGYITRLSFEKGFNVTTWNEVLLWEEDGDYYRWDGTLPKDVPAGSTPETAGGIGTGAWVSVGDASLRSDLTDIDGFSIVGSANYSDIRSYTGSKKRIYVYGKSNIFDGGNGIFELDVNDTTSVDDGGTVLVSASGGRYKRISDGVAMLEWWEGANVDDPDSDCLSAWNKFANSDVYSKLKLRAGTYRFSNSLTTVVGKQKDIEGQGFWKTILQVDGVGHGLQAFETLTGRRFQIRRVNGSGIVEEPGFGTGTGAGFRAANSLSSSAYTRLEQVLVTGHFNIGFEINAVSGSYINCNAYNIKGDGYAISGGSNHFEKCWAEHNNERAFVITGIGNQLFQCYEEHNGLTDPTLSQVYIGTVSGIGSGMDTRIEDFNYNPRNSQLNVPVFDCNAASIYISAIEEVAVDANKLVCSFSQYCINSHYDGRGLISGGVSGGYPATYNQNKATVKGVSTAGGGLLPSTKSILTTTQLVRFTSADQAFSGAPGGFILGNNNASTRESATAWNLAYPGSNLNIYSVRINVLTSGLKLSLKFFNQGYESPALVTTEGTVGTVTAKGTGFAPLATGQTATDTLLGLKLLSTPDSVAGDALIEIEYSYS